MNNTYKAFAIITLSLSLSGCIGLTQASPTAVVGNGNTTSTNSTTNSRNFNSGNDTVNHSNSHNSNSGTIVQVTAPNLKSVAKTEDILYQEVQSLEKEITELEKSIHSMAIDTHRIATQSNTDTKRISLLEYDRAVDTLNLIKRYTERYHKKFSLTTETVVNIYQSYDEALAVFRSKEYYSEPAIEVFHRWSISTMPKIIAKIERSEKKTWSTIVKERTVVPLKQR